MIGAEKAHITNTKRIAKLIVATGSRRKWYKKSDSLNRFHLDAMLFSPCNTNGRVYQSINNVNDSVDDHEDKTDHHDI